MNLRAQLAGGVSISDAFPDCIGGAELCDGSWRFFASNRPSCGIVSWNEQWRRAWGLLQTDIFTFGEDVFGNQLVVTSNSSTVYICDHESGSCRDLELGPADLLMSVLQHGLSWINFYSDGSLAVAKDAMIGLTWEEHLHWNQPLILGGQIRTDNLSILNRHSHLVGHEKLWKQISGLPPGAEFRTQ